MLQGEREDKTTWREVDSSFAASSV